MRTFLLTSVSLLLALAACSSPAHTPAESAADADDALAATDAASPADAAADTVPDGAPDVAADITALEVAPDSAVDVPQGPTPITSCVGRCFLLLTDGGNACSCNPSCVDKGNCCPDFQATCACQSDGDCDDKSDCTQDSCAKNWCKNLPTGDTCCASDAECSGGTACKPMKCLKGACTAVPTNCDDGLECTVDFCNADGSCGHKGAVGMCAIGGACVTVGTVSATAACASCTAGNSSGWTIAAGSCLIDGVCHSAGETANVGCQVCDSGMSGWTVQSGKACDDGDTCTSGDKCDATGACKGTAKATCCKSDQDCPVSGVASCDAYTCTLATGTCTLGAIPGCCMSGVCCDIGKMQLQPAGTICGIKSGVEFKCEGVVSSKRDIFSGCSGTDANKCSDASPGYGPWTVDKTCSDGATCVVQSGGGGTICTGP